MASGSGVPALAERVDVHKSCKSLEILLNVLNDYCEVAGAVATLQKKLAKALRETASLKVTGEIAGTCQTLLYLRTEVKLDLQANAMNASASMFETLSDVDSKFSKFSDKEYDNISAEVKKWFKKLAVR
jgi:hypothetical protein